MINPDQIRTEEFEVSVLGGYKRESVDSFFKSVVDDYEKLYNENAELTQKLKVCVSKIDEYRKDEQFLKAAIINAEKLNETTLKDIEEREKQSERKAKETAESILKSAKADAENIVEKARADSEASVKAYEVDAARKIAEIEKNVKAEEEKLARMKKEVSDFKNTLLKLYKQHLSTLSKLQSVPNNIEPKPEPAAEKEEPQQTAQDVGLVENPEIKPEINPIIQESADKKAPAFAEADKTAEFVIEKTIPSKEERTDIFDREFKYRDLKFGTDFDLKKDE